MSLDPKILRLLHASLAIVDDHSTEGPRLLEDAQRLWSLCQKFLNMNLISPATADTDALELACFALQLPQRQSKPPTAGRLGRSNLKDRAEQSAELLVTTFDGKIDE